MRWLIRIAIVLVLAIGALAVANGSWWGTPPADPQVRLIAHRGLHQTFHRDGLDNDTCTAERIHPPTHGYLENTIASMRAAFESGAEIVELDVHPTTDGHFAVIHDWTLECRTNGTGRTRDHDANYLKSLDIGYGYTADGGQTFPFRGLGRGAMPLLDEVLAAFPQGRFLVNFKSNDASEADRLAAMLEAAPQWRPLVWGAYGGDAPTLAAAERIEGLATWTRRSLVDCLLQYIAIGWTGIMPEPCRNSYVMVPINAAPWLWGWPDLFLQRMREAGSSVILLGPYEAGDPGTAGIDDLTQLAQVPATFTGYLWTNRIELIAPALKGAAPP